MELRKAEDKLASMGLTFSLFGEYNAKRCIESFGETPGNYPVELWGLGLAGEAGELAQELKRLRDNERRYIAAVVQDRPEDTDELAQQRAAIIAKIRKEIGDIMPYVDMIAQSFDWTLEECTIEKFNEVSDRRGSDVKIPIHP
jgi:NTP pyrophosphatase (non-canonical NTP hydrolase)